MFNFMRDLGHQLKELASTSSIFNFQCSRAKAATLRDDVNKETFSFNNADRALGCCCLTSWTICI